MNQLKSETGPNELPRSQEKSEAAAILFAGPDEMSLLCRGFDWSLSPLGPVENWPISLRITVQTVLAHPFPTIVLWGAELVQIYNQGYREIMGVKHPAGLGQPTRECWPEVWHINAPIYERVWRGESFSMEDALFPITRSGVLEEAWFTLSYSPVRDESGAIAGVFLTVIETTRRLKAERALRHSEEQFRLAATSSDVVYRMSADWTQMKTLTSKGFLRNAESSQSTWLDTYIPPEDQNTVWQAIQRAIDTKSPFELEHRVILADGTIGWVVSRALPILDEKGTIIEWFGNANDVTEHKRAEATLSMSEEKYRALFNSMDEAYAVVEVMADEEGRWNDFLFLDANPAFMEHTTMPYPVGRTATQLLGAPNPRWAQVYGEVAETGTPVRIENEEPTLGRVFDLNIFRLGGSGSRRVAVLFSNITERKQREELQAFLLKISDALRPLSDSAEMEHTAMRVLGQHLGVNRAFYATVGEDGESWSVQHDYADGVPSNAGIYPLSDFQRRRWAQWQAGQMSSTADSKNDPAISAEDRAAYVALNTRAAIGVPVVKAGRFAALLSVNQTKPRMWTQAELTLTHEVAERTWAAIERAKVEEALRASQSRLESIANLVPDLLWDSEPDGSSNWYNQRWLQYTGQSFEEAVVWGWVNAIHPDDREASARRYRESVGNGELLRQEHRIRRYDGEYRWFAVTACPLKDESGKVIKMYGAATDMHESRLMHEALREREAELARVQRIGGVGGVDIDVAAGMTGERSPEYRRLHGLSPETTQETHEEWQKRVHPDDRKHAETTLREALAGTDNRYESEYRIIRPNDGQERWISARLTIERDQSGQPMRLVGAHIDITQRKHAENALRESQERLNLAINSAHLGTCDWDYQEGIMRGNALRFRLFGLNPEQETLTNEQFLEEIYPHDRETTWNSITSQLTEKGEYQVEYRIKRPDDGVRSITEAGRVIGWKGSEPARVVSILSDVTEQREAQEVLRRSNEALSLTLDQHLASEVVRTELIRRIVRTQEEERGRISRELHDNLGQHLTAVMLGLQTLESQLGSLTGGKREKEVPQLDKLRSLVDGLMRAAHDQARQLRPAELDAMGLETALRRYAQEWSERTGVEVDFQTVEWYTRLAPEVETTLYRVAQEALTNVIRHANASFVIIELKQNQNNATLVVEDDGIGFDIEGTTNRLGVLGMKERLDLISGLLDIESIPGEGTAIIAHIPL